MHLFFFEKLLRDISTDNEQIADSDASGKCSGVGAKVDIKREMVDIDYAWFCELVLRY